MPSVWLVDALAGAIAGACAAIISHPLDTMRVRMQTAASTANATASAVWAGLRGSEEGVVRALYRGVMPLTLTLSLSHALAFATNELTRRYLSQAARPMGPTTSSSEDRLTPAKLGTLFAAGCASGVPVALFSTPSIFLKIQLQMSQQRDAASKPIRAMMCAAQAAVAGVCRQGADSAEGGGCSLAASCFFVEFQFCPMTHESRAPGPWTLACPGQSTD